MSGSLTPTRKSRIGPIAAFLQDNPGASAAAVQSWLQSHGISLSARTVRRDVSTARATLLIGGNPEDERTHQHWTADFSRQVVMDVISERLTIDKGATTEEVRAHVTKSLHREIPLAEVAPLAREVWQQIYVTPAIAAAQEQAAAIAGRQPHQPRDAHNRPAAFSALQTEQWRGLHNPHGIDARGLRIELLLKVMAGLDAMGLGPWQPLDLRQAPHALRFLKTAIELIESLENEVTDETALTLRRHFEETEETSVTASGPHT